MLFDIHVHTSFSFDSDLDFQVILEEAENRGLDGVCITDHQNMDIAGHYKEGIQENGLVVIIGMEYETPDGDFLIFGPFESISKSLPADELLKTVRENNGIAVAAHPFRKNRTVEEYLIAQNRCQAIESVNGRNTTLENLCSQTWLKKYSLAQTGGSDAHTLEELGSICTLFNTPIYSKTDLIEAIRQGHCLPVKNTYSSKNEKSVQHEIDSSVF